MCLACEEEAFYRAYLEHMAKKAAQESAPPARPEPSADNKPVCDEARSAPAAI